MALSFQLQCQQFADKIQVNLCTVVRRAAAQVYADIVVRWPVDTGYSRRNWQVSVDPPPTDAIGSPPKKKAGEHLEVLPPLYDPNGANTAIPIAKDVTQVWIVNNVEYAQRLEEGWSKQAPQGAVRIALASAQAEMSAIVAGLE
jgi:hypothetical protein